MGLMKQGILYVNERFAALFGNQLIADHPAISWVCSQPNIQSIVFGASSRSNTHSPKQIVDSLWSQRQVQPVSHNADAA
jgi:aryl-alcohol dehydrogenase-like predicted oxidoreductase